MRQVQDVHVALGMGWLHHDRSSILCPAQEEFATEIERAKEGKLKSTPWGSSFGHAPEILHGSFPGLCIRPSACKPECSFTRC